MGSKMLSRSNYALLLLFILAVGTMVALTRTNDYSFLNSSSSPPNSFISSSQINENDSLLEKKFHHATNISTIEQQDTQTTKETPTCTKEETQKAPSPSHSILSPTISPLSSPPSPLKNLPELSQMLQFALAQECATTNWRQGLYLNCDPIVMGAFNAINKLQVCIRWAIDSGAGLIRPKFTTRGDALTDIRGNFPKVPIEYLLDERYLWESLAINCPQLKVIELDAVKDNATFLPGVEVEYFIERFYKGEFGPKITAILQSNNAFVSPQSPVVITEKETIGAWIRSYDTEEFQISFRNIFRFSRSYVPFAEQILSKLPTIFFGVHLRLESDWTANTDDVMYSFLDKILEHNTTANPIAYVACGEEEKLAQFTTLAATRGVQVVHKWNLLNEAGREFLSALDFDQMGMVDRLVLEKADYFYGVAGSSFSFSLGQHRHQVQTGNMEYFARSDERQYLEGAEGDMWYGLMW